MPGFSVVADALISASAGVTATLATLRGCPVRLLDPGPAALGDATFAAALTDFCDRWQRGVTALVDDGEQYDNRLRDAASTYIGMDVGLAAVLRTRP